jgi:hypothetical protein
VDQEEVQRDQRKEVKNAVDVDCVIVVTTCPPKKVPTKVPKKVPAKALRCLQNACALMASPAWHAKREHAALQIAISHQDMEDATSRQVSVNALHPTEALIAKRISAQAAPLLLEPLLL